MKSLRVLGSVMLAFITSSCATGIEIKRVTSATAVQEGNPWNLPMTQFKVAITRHIKGCAPTMKAGVEVIATPVLAVDEAQRYVLRGSGHWATSDITSTLAPSGISLGLNAQTADTTSAVVSSLVGAMVQIVPLVATVDTTTNICQPDVLKAVTDLYPAAGDSLKQQIDKKTAALETATARVVLLTAQTQVDPALKPKLVVALGDQADRQSELASLQKQFAHDIELTTDVQVVTWPKRSADFRTRTPFSIDRQVLKKWVLPSQEQEAARQLEVNFALYRRDPADGTWTPGEQAMAGATNVDLSIGVPVRLGQVGRFLTCVHVACPPTSQPDMPSTDPNVIVNDVQVLQLGQLYVVPTAGGLFKSESAIITLDANGLPTSIQVAERASVASSAAGVAKDTATQLAQLPAQISAAELARTKARVDQLNANAALGTAQANATVQGQTSALAAQTALIAAQTNLANAQINAGLPLQTSAVAAQTALLNAQAALATAQVNAGNVDQTSALAAQTSLINAQAAQINAAAALAKAQAGIQ